jgi:hypothetical protein
MKIDDDMLLHFTAKCGQLEIMNGLIEKSICKLEKSLSASGIG